MLLRCSRVSNYLFDYALGYAHYMRVFTPQTCRAARALLGWSQRKLCKEASVGLSTVINFENEHRTTTGENFAAMEDTLKKAGIEFLNHGSPGVRLRPKAKLKR